MSRHRAESPRRRATPPSRHRARPRYGRIAVLGSSVTVTAVAMLGAVGVLPSVATGGATPAVARGPAGGASQGAAEADLSVAAYAPPTDSPADPEPSDDDRSGSSQAGAPASDAGSTAESATEPAAPGSTSAESVDDVLPANSGRGRRVVFSESRQRVWLVGEGNVVERTYLVSGSIYDNLEPGTYSVYSRSEQAWGIEDSGTMRYFVRFAEGDTGAAIGFHDIPVSDGVPLQTEAQLGTPLSHGCIRQATDDAIALWEFAPVGTKVVVTV